jgi:hypothetical protein
LLALLPVSSAAASTESHTWLTRREARARSAKSSAASANTAPSANVVRPLTTSATAKTAPV